MAIGYCVAHRPPSGGAVKNAYKSAGEARAFIAERGILLKDVKVYQIDGPQWRPEDPKGAYRILVQKVQCMG